MDAVDRITRTFELTTPLPKKGFIFPTRCPLMSRRLRSRRFVPASSVGAWLHVDGLPNP